MGVVEAFGGENSNAPRELEDVLRLEYRSKFLNPRWAEAMAAQGSGGAFETSQRMTALVGWGGTVGFSDAFVYDQAVETYVLDEDMAQTLRRNNPDAFKNVLQRFIEASGRGLWDADEALLKKLQAMYQDLDDQMRACRNNCLYFIRQTRFVVASVHAQMWRGVGGCSYSPSESMETPSMAFSK